MKRWLVEIVYRYEGGLVSVPHEVEELDEVQDLVEGGPHWDTVKHIFITLNRPASDIPSLTVEEAEKL